MPWVAQGAAERSPVTKTSCLGSPEGCLSHPSGRARRPRAGGSLEGGEALFDLPHPHERVLPRIPSQPELTLPHGYQGSARLTVPDVGER